MFTRPPSAEARLRALALLFFVGLAFLTLHPILFSTGTKTVGYDFFNYNWNFWWIRHALTTLGLNVYQTDSLTQFTFHVPANLIGTGKHVTLTLAYDGWTVPAQVQPGGDQRKLAIAVDWIRFTRSEELNSIK
jgi:hypothetical protein